MVGTAVVLPFILFVVAGCFDLTRLFLNGIFAQEIALLTAKIATSVEPDGYAPPDEEMVGMVRGASGEGEVGEQRVQFWSDLTSAEGAWQFGSKSYLTEKEKEVLNLAYGFAVELNPRVYFPIPAGFNGAGPTGNSPLGGRVNCSIYFRYPDALPKTLPTNPADCGGQSGDVQIADGSTIDCSEAGVSGYDEVVLASRDRIIHVDCVVPLVFGGIFGLPNHRLVSRTAYAYRSGNIKRGA
jgi:hypothetical protein